MNSTIKRVSCGYEGIRENLRVRAEYVTIAITMFVITVLSTITFQPTIW